MSESRRLPARVYWVRRFVVLGIPLILIAVALATYLPDRTFDALTRAQFGYGRPEAA